MVKVTKGKGSLLCTIVGDHGQQLKGALDEVASGRKPLTAMQKEDFVPTSTVGAAFYRRKENRQ